jgi:hypothetical protein
VKTDQSFFPDDVLPFVYLMLGGCINLEWAAEPKPCGVPAWIVYTVLGVSGVFGQIAAFGAACECVETEFMPTADSDEVDLAVEN